MRSPYDDDDGEDLFLDEFGTNFDDLCSDGYAMLPLSPEMQRIRCAVANSLDATEDEP